jgi:uncharacterized membrane protein HdeD (DUF308 family)
VLKSQLVGAVMLVFGVLILIVLGSFILSVVLFILQLLAVAIGVFLVVAGVALLVRRRWMKGPWERGPAPATT